jgi:hypothetical protein
MQRGREDLTTEDTESTEGAKEGGVEGVWADLFPQPLPLKLEGEFVDGQNGRCCGVFRGGTTAVVGRWRGDWALAANNCRGTEG